MSVSKPRLLYRVPGSRPVHPMKTLSLHVAKRMRSVLCRRRNSLLFCAGVRRYLSTYNSLVVRLATTDCSGLKLTWHAALQRLTEIAVEASGAQSACLVIIGGGAEYAVATSMEPPGHCQIYESARLISIPRASLTSTRRNMPSIRTLEDPLQRADLEHCKSLQIVYT